MVAIFRPLCEAPEEPVHYPTHQNRHLQRSLPPESHISAPVRMTVRYGLRSQRLPRDNHRLPRLPSYPPKFLKLCHPWPTDPQFHRKSTFPAPRPPSSLDALGAWTSLVLVRTSIIPPSQSLHPIRPRLLQAGVLASLAVGVPIVQARRLRCQIRDRPTGRRYQVRSLV